MGIIRRWYGTETEAATRWKLSNGDIVRSFGGAFAARRTPVGTILEKCQVGKTWETKFRDADHYIDSLKDTRKG